MTIVLNLPVIVQMTVVTTSVVRCVVQMLLIVQMTVVLKLMMSVTLQLMVVVVQVLRSGVV